MMERPQLIQQIITTAIPQQFSQIPEWARMAIPSYGGQQLVMEPELLITQATR